MSSIKLDKSSFQALGIANYAIDFMKNIDTKDIPAEVYDRVKLFHTDAVLCGISALALQTNAPTILRNEALDYHDKNGATVFGSKQLVPIEKAVLAI